jgi:xanthine dehydrogenase YagR molybdenum-binding subunit
MTTIVRDQRTDILGRPIDRVDGVAKVSGAARYADDARVDAPLYAALVRSTIGRGRIRSIDETQARTVDGVVEILTYRNAGALIATGFDFESGSLFMEGPKLLPLQTGQVFYRGQIVAAVVAGSLESARAAADLVRVAYHEEVAQFELDDRARESADVPPMSPFGSELQMRRGDFLAAFESSPVQVDLAYRTPPEHHHPMEPAATVAVWDDAGLTLYDSTQYVFGVRSTLAAFFGLPVERVRVICPFVGGGFGCKGFVWPHVAVAALAAKAVGKPVKLALTRAEMATLMGYRSETEQRIRLGADEDGTLRALGHDTMSVTSHIADFPENAGILSSMLYGCENVSVTHRVARLDVGTPTAMRAPGEAPGSFALESALDELAYRLKLDPIELRARNETSVDGSTGLPFTSRHLIACLREGAQRFGWSKRTPEPRSMREGREFVGYGVAAATYPAMQIAAEAKLTVDARGRFVLEVGAADLGTGTYTIAAQLAAQELGVPVDAIDVRIGDTNLPRGPIAGGSMTAASIAPVISDVARGMCALARVSSESVDRIAAFADAAAAAGGTLEQRASHDPENVEERFSPHSFGAHFCEVRYDEELARVRVARFTTVLDVGRILNAKTARSQAIGGVVFGISMALLEATLRDPRNGAIVNDNFADYHIPVNADIPPIDVKFVEEPDYTFNPLGVRGVGEIGIVGVAAAIANAVYHASGVRVRDLPILPEKLLLGE